MLIAPFAMSAHAQRGRGGPAPATTAKQQAPIDLTGYWVSVVTEDWRYRMLTPPKGNADYLPVTPEARSVAEQWDPTRDEAAGEQCRGYGAVGVMRLQLTESPPPPSSLVPWFPPAVEAVLLRALAKEPSQRFPSVDDFVVNLSEVARLSIAAASAPGSRREGMEFKKMLQAGRKRSRDAE